MYVFQLLNGRLINHITTGLLRMVLYTKELHLFTFEEWAKIGNTISNGGPSYRAAQAYASFILRARSPALHLSLGNVLVTTKDGKVRFYGIAKTTYLQGRTIFTSILIKNLIYLLFELTAPRNSQFLTSEQSPCPYSTPCISVTI